MNLSAMLRLLSGFVFLACLNIEAAEANANSGAAQQLHVLERGPHHRRVRHIAEETDEFGISQVRTNVYTELAGGMHYWDTANSHWAESVEEVTLTDDGAVAEKGPLKVRFKSNLNDPAGSVTITSPGGHRIRASTLALAYFDPVSGQDVIVATVQNTQGEIIPPNQVLYRNAFDNIDADVLYIWKKGSFEQFVILREQPAQPSEYGLPNDTSRLEVLTEIFEAPAFRVNTSYLSRTTDPALRASLAEPDWVDQFLTFGDVSFGHGKGFLAADDEPEAEHVRNRRTQPMGKKLQDIGTRKILFESIEFNAVVDELATLQTAKRKPDRSLRQLIAEKGRTTPARKQYASLEAISVAHNPTPRRAGYVLDYTVVPSAPTDYVFQGHETYYVSGPITLTGTTTFRAGAVIKCASSAQALITVATGAPVHFEGKPYSPVIFTGKDDRTVGETISGSFNSIQGRIYGNPMVSLSGGTYAVDNIALRFATTGMEIGGIPSSGTRIKHAQFLQCENGLRISAGSAQSVMMQNVLFYNVINVVRELANINLTAEHITVMAATRFNYLPQNSTVTLKNSLLSKVTSAGPYIAGSDSSVTTHAQDVFETVGVPGISIAGGAFLRQESSHVNAGTAACLIAPEIQRMTTMAPTYVPGPITQSSTLRRHVTLDEDVADRGYHYWPSDYILGNVRVESALSLADGVTVAFFGGGFQLATGGSWKSEGKPDQMNRFVRTCNIFEQNSNVGPRVSGYLFSDAGSTAPVSARFSEFHFNSRWGVGPFQASAINQWNFDDCYFLNAIESITPQVAGLQVIYNNCVFERGSFSATMSNDPAIGVPFSLFFRHNLFYEAPVFIDRDSLASEYSELFDNFFDSASVTLLGFPSDMISNNAFRIGVTPAGVSPVSVPAGVYANGPFGRFYYADAWLGLASVTDAATGSVPLYHYTTRLSQVKEGATSKDIGFHYVAASNGLPMDVDEDGLADYAEDANSNGIVNTTETDFTDDDTDGDSYSDGLEILLGRDPLKGAAADAGNAADLKIFTPSFHH